MSLVIKSRAGKIIYPKVTTRALQLQSQDKVVEALESSGTWAFADLAGLTLREKGLTCQMWTGSTFANCNLIDIDFANKSNFHTCNFIHSVMTRCTFQNALFELTNFSYANIDSCDFRQSLFPQTSFAGAKITNCNFSGCYIHPLSILTADFALSGASKTLIREYNRWQYQLSDMPSLFLHDLERDHTHGGYVWMKSFTKVHAKLTIEEVKKPPETTLHELMVALLELNGNVYS